LGYLSDENTNGLLSNAEEGTFLFSLGMAKTNNTSTIFLILHIKLEGKMLRIQIDDNITEINVCNYVTMDKCFKYVYVLENEKYYCRPKNEVIYMMQNNERNNGYYNLITFITRMTKSFDPKFTSKTSTEIPPKKRKMINVNTSLYMLYVLCII